MHRTVPLLFVLLGLTLQASAQKNATTNTNVRTISREECIRLALEHDLNIRIARHEAAIAQFALKGAYGYYEPTLSVASEYRYNKDDLSSQTDSSSAYGASRSTEFDALIRTNMGFKSSFQEDERVTKTQTASYLSAGTALSGTTPIGTIWTLGGSIGSSDKETSFNYFMNGIDFANVAETNNGSLSSPNLTSIFQTNRANTVSFSDLDQRNNMVGLSLVQPLLRNFWTDSGRTQIQLKKKDVQISECTLALRIMERISQVEKAYYGLIAAREAVKVAEMSLALAQDLLAETGQMVKAGVATALDAKQVESQVQTSIANLIEAKRFEADQEDVLKTCITDDYGKAYNISYVPSEQLIAVPTAYDLNDSWLRALALRPDYNGLKTEVQRQGLVVRYQKNQTLPQLDFKGYVGKWVSDQDVQSTSSILVDEFNDVNLRKDYLNTATTSSTSTSDSRPEWALGVAMSIPIGGNINARAQYKIAKETQARLQEQVQLLHMNILVEVQRSLRMLKAKFEQVSAYREARIYAEAALEAEKKKYANGNSTASTVLEIQRRLQFARANEVRALADYNTALVDFYLAEGSTLERNQIEIAYK